MSSYRYVVLACALSLAIPVQAQEGIDWGSIMMADATGRAQAAEARRIAGNPYAQGPGAKRNDLEATRTRANCAKLQEQYDAGARHPNAPRLLGLCRRYGYL